MENTYNLQIQKEFCDILIIGGGAAGCAAAHRLSKRDEKVILIDKGDITRSGCLAAGVNAINAWIAKTHTPSDYVEYAYKDSHGIASKKLLLSMSTRLNEAVDFLESIGLKILKDPSTGEYQSRSWRNLKVSGENIKPLLADSIKGRKNLTILERTQALSYLLSTEEEPRVMGVMALKVGEPIVCRIEAKAVICTTGGASGIYAPNNKGMSAHKMWYSPFNTGAGFAMGIMAGAELTTLEMRFVALRAEDSCAPTGTLAVGAKANQVNILGEEYEARYGFTTSQRVLAARKEIEEGRGPVRLITPNLSLEERMGLIRAYFNMAPLQSLKWLEEESILNSQEEKPLSVFVEGTEPYILGGHTASGYYIGEDRSTTLPGLFAGGDVAGGSPQKYVSGAIVEGWIAADAALNYLSKEKEVLKGVSRDKSISQDLVTLLQAFSQNITSNLTISGLEEAAQKVMDELAGGKSRGYIYNEEGLKLAEERILELFSLSGKLAAKIPRDLNKIWELRERLIVARSLIKHLEARKETRWPGFGEYIGYDGILKEYELFINSKLIKASPVPPLRDNWGEIKIIKRDIESGLIMEK